MSRLSFQIPVVSEPRFDDPNLDSWARSVKDAINQLTSSLNTVVSNASTDLKGIADSP